MLTLLVDAMQQTTLTDDDEGKPVVNATGDEIGIVSEIRNGNAHVKPDPSITDKIKAKLGWDQADEESYHLEERRIDSVTDDEIRLNQ